MKEGMEEPYAEGVAIHGDPEPCVGAREGADEALGRGACRRAMEPRNQEIGVPTQFEYRKATPRAALARAGRGPRAVGEPGMHGTFMRENRENPLLGHELGQVVVRLGKAEAVSLG